MPQESRVYKSLLNARVNLILYFLKAELLMTQIEVFIPVKSISLDNIIREVQ